MSDAPGQMPRRHRLTIVVEFHHEPSALAETEIAKVFATLAAQFPAQVSHLLARMLTLTPLAGHPDAPDLAARWRGRARCDALTPEQIAAVIATGKAADEAAQERAAASALRAAGRLN